MFFFVRAPNWDPIKLGEFVDRCRAVLEELATVLHDSVAKGLEWRLGRSRRADAALVGGRPGVVLRGLEQEARLDHAAAKADGAQDADLLLDMSDNIGGKSLCALGDAAHLLGRARRFRQ